MIIVYTLFWACKSMSSYFAQICPNFNLSWERPGDLTGTGPWGQRPLSGRWQGIEIYLYGEYRVFYGLFWKEAALILCHLIKKSNSEWHIVHLTSWMENSRPNGVLSLKRLTASLYSGRLAPKTQCLTSLYPLFPINISVPKTGPPSLSCHFTTAPEEKVQFAPLHNSN